MKQYKVLLSQTANRQLLGLGNEEIKNIKTHLLNLSENPYRKRPGADIKKLEGSFNPELWRLRVGKYRAVYTITDHQVKVTEIIHRGKGYSWLT